MTTKIITITLTAIILVFSATPMIADYTIALSESMEIVEVVGVEEITLEETTEDTDIFASMEEEIQLAINEVDIDFIGVFVDFNVKITKDIGNYLADAGGGSESLNWFFRPVGQMTGLGHDFDSFVDKIGDLVKSNSGSAIQEMKSMY